MGERLFSVAVFFVFTWRMSHALALRPWDAMVIVSECLVVGFMVCRRRALAVSTRPLDWLLAMVGTVAPMLVVAGGRAAVPPLVGLTLMIGGLVFTLWGKLILRRSFGLAAANRGVVRGGAYAIVRHPIYAGYGLVYVGFFLLNPTFWNVSVYFGVIALLVFRILAEERILALDPRYRDYRARVRWRLVPGVF